MTVTTGAVTSGLVTSGSLTSGAITSGTTGGNFNEIGDSLAFRRSERE